jgi:excisionase family DNA binding protein
MGTSQQHFIVGGEKTDMPALKETTRLRRLPQAADALGVTVACLRSWIYRRAISYTKIGRSVRISDETIQQIIDRGTVPAIEDRS